MILRWKLSAHCFERFRGELFGEDLEGNLEGRQGDEGKSLINDRTTGGEEG